MEVFIMAKVPQIGQEQCIRERLPIQATGIPEIMPEETGPGDVFVQGGIAEQGQNIIRFRGVTYTRDAAGLDRMQQRAVALARGGNIDADNAYTGCLVSMMAGMIENEQLSLTSAIERINAIRTSVQAIDGLADDRKAQIFSALDSGVRTLRIAHSTLFESGAESTGNSSPADVMACGDDPLCGDI